MAASLVEGRALSPLSNERSQDEVGSLGRADDRHRQNATSGGELAIRRTHGSVLILSLSSGELVAEKDDAVAIFGPGEEVHLEFAAPRQGAPEGWTRRLVLETRGWCKDLDLYTKDGETVEPLPGRATPGRDALHRRYNTRYQAGL